MNAEALKLQKVDTAGTVYLIKVRIYPVIKQLEGQQRSPSAAEQR
jgi:hypothetical protein